MAAIAWPEIVELQVTREKTQGEKLMYQGGNQSESDFYQNLRLYLRTQVQTTTNSSLLKSLTEYLLLPPDLLHLILRLLLDESVPLREKAKFGLALAYFLSPIDLIPDFLLGPIGLVDDVAISIYLIDSILSQADPATVESLWAGEAEVIQWVQSTTNRLNDLMGGSFLRRLDPLLARLFP